MIARYVSKVFKKLHTVPVTKSSLIVDPEFIQNIGLEIMITGSLIPYLVYFLWRRNSYS